MSRGVEHNVTQRRGALTHSPRSRDQQPHLGEDVSGVTGQVFEQLHQ